MIVVVFVFIVSFVFFVEFLVKYEIILVVEDFDFFWGLFFFFNGDMLIMEFFG